MGRTELAAMAAGLNLESISQTDSRLLSGALAAAQTAIAAPFASLHFLGIEQTWYLGAPEDCDAIGSFVAGVVRATLHADEVIEVGDLVNHPTYSHTVPVRHEPGLRWSVSVPIRGYNNLMIGALTLLDVQPRMPLSASEMGTLENLVAVIEAALESHRMRIAARAQRALLVKRLQDAHKSGGPFDGEQRRMVHDIKNALTVIRLNSQTMEESGQFDGDSLADIRGALRKAEESARRLKTRVSTPIPTHRPTWSSICENQRLRIENVPHHPDHTVAIVDESPNLIGHPAPDCLSDVTNLLVDRALELSDEGSELTVSLRLFPHFARFSVCAPVHMRSLEEMSSPVEPVLVHPARNALLAIGGSITSSGTEKVQRFSAWFPLDDEATFVI